MAKFPEAENRLFKNKFVCRKCKTPIRADTLKVLEGKVICRRKNCMSNRFKPVRKK